MTTILLVDDQPTERRLLYHALKGSYRVVEAGDADEALRVTEGEPPDLVLADLHLPPNLETPEEGIRLHARLRERFPLLPVIIVTGDQDRATALDMVSRGVADFLLKPIDPTVLRIVIARAIERARLERELEELRARLEERYSFGKMIGKSAAQRAVFSKLRKLARVRTTVLLLGESGTGKSAAARALHLESDHASAPFVVVDGAAIPESLIESELFGHRKGAFSGADRDAPGLIPTAHGGTLFLDEIGNLSLAAQAKLLLFLDRHVVTPVGSTEEIPVDVRLVAATNRDLNALVRSGRFREDLYFRIDVASVHLPPLRERTEDILPLCNQMLAELCRDMRRPRVGMSPDAAGILEEYPWPGNVRELQHVLESSLVLLAETERTMGPEDLVLPAQPRGRPVPDAPDAPAPPEDAEAGIGGAEIPFKERVAEFEKQLLRNALEKSGGNKAAAGRLLGLDENQIRYLCRKHELGS